MSLVKNSARNEAQMQRAGKDRDIYVSSASRGFAARSHVLSRHCLLAAHNVELARKSEFQTFHSDDVIR